MLSLKSVIVYSSYFIFNQSTSVIAPPPFHGFSVGPHALISWVLTKRTKKQIVGILKLSL